jgi:hypothetical protein
MHISRVFIYCSMLILPIAVTRPLLNPLRFLSLRTCLRPQSVSSIPFCDPKGNDASVRVVVRLSSREHIVAGTVQTHFLYLHSFSFQFQMPFIVTQAIMLCQ